METSSAAWQQNIQTLAKISFVDQSVNQSVNQSINQPVSHLSSHHLHHLLSPPSGEFCSDSSSHDLTELLTEVIRRNRVREKERERDWIRGKGRVDHVMLVSYQFNKILLVQQKDRARQSLNLREMYNSMSHCLTLILSTSITRLICLQTSSAFWSALQ